jgi:microcystin-dependent protein
MAGLRIRNVAPGTIVPFSGTVIPNGYLLCDGLAVSRTTYANLFAVINETCGQGDNINTFNLPDLRGRFLRGVDNGATRDPDRATRTAMNVGGNTGDNVGSVQGHAAEAHKHIAGYGSSPAPAPRYGYATGLASARLDHFNSIDTTDGAYTSTEGVSTETRPINANVNFIIKY